MTAREACVRVLVAEMELRLIPGRARRSECCCVEPWLFGIEREMRDWEGEKDDDEEAAMGREI